MENDEESPKESRRMAPNQMPAEEAKDNPKEHLACIGASWTDSDPGPHHVGIRQYQT